MSGRGAFHEVEIFGGFDSNDPSRLAIGQESVSQQRKDLRAACWRVRRAANDRLAWGALRPAMPMAL